MPTTLNQSALDQARRLIAEGRVVLDERDKWSEPQPSAEQENTFIEAYAPNPYAKWYLGGR